MKPLTLILTLILIVFSAKEQFCYSQNPFSVPFPNRKSVKVPFEYVNNFIVVEVKLNGFLSVKFLVDTGAQHTLITDKRIAFLLGLEYVKEFRIAGADLQRELVARLVKAVDIGMGDISVEKLPILVLDEDYFLFDELTGQEIHGIVGGDFLRRFILGINYKSQKLIFHNPDNFYKSRKKHQVLPISTESHKPYINVNISLQHSDTLLPSKLLLDSGASLTMLLDIEDDDKILIPDNAIPGNIGKGLGGDLFGYWGVVDNLTFGGFDLQNIPSSFQIIENDSLEMINNNRDGLIGNQILDRFHVIIDYQRDKLYLQPNKRFRKVFRINKSGLSIIGAGERLNKFIIQDLLVDSPGFNAGLQSGDEILSINRIPYFFLSFNKINKIMSGKDGRKVKISVKRKGEKRRFNFRLKNSLKKYQYNS